MPNLDLRLRDDCDKYKKVLNKALVENGPPYEFQKNGKTIFEFTYPDKAYCISNKSMLELADKSVKMSHFDIKVSRDKNSVIKFDYKIYQQTSQVVYEEITYGCADPVNNIIYICPENLINLAKQGSKLFNIDYNQAFSSLIRSVVIHEMVHLTFNKIGTYLNDRLSEGYANFIPFLLGAEIDRKMIALKSSTQNPEYNYYFIFANLLHTGFESLFDKQTDLLLMDAEEATSFFYNNILKFGQPYYLYESKCNVRVSGNWNGIFGFGSEEVMACIGGNVKYIVGFRGVLATSSIEKLDGILHPYTQIITNQIGIDNIPFYDVIPQNIHIIDKSDIDFKVEFNSEIIEKLNVKSTVDSILRHIKKGKKFQKYLSN